jgi:hypothetical protein
LYYLRARYYAPSTGRFTQRHPVPGVLSWPDTLNAYPYALNNPANLTDPSGEFVLVPVIIGGTIGGMIGGVGYVVSNPGQSLGEYLRSWEFWRAAGAGAVGGLVSGLMPLGGAGLVSAIGYGITGGMAAGAAGQLALIIPPHHAAATLVRDDLERKWVIVGRVVADIF